MDTELQEYWKEFEFQMCSERRKNMRYYGERVCDIESGGNRFY